MKINNTVRSVLLASTFILGAQSSFAAILDELTPADQEKVKNGEQVAYFPKSDMPGAPWPICKVYQWINATPEEAMAIFTDYELQKTYVPDLIKSQISKQDKTVTDVDYTISLPMNFGKESYTAHDTISSYDSGASYQVKWTVTPTSSIKVSEGDARFEPMDSTKGKGTILAYNSFIYPTRWGVTMGWVIERAKKEVTDTVTAISKQIDTERQTQQDLVNKQIQTLRDALAQ